MSSNDWERRALAAEAALEEARAERARLWEELQRLQRERQDVAHLRGVVGHMEGSVSWKVTEPLRAAKTLAIRVRRQLEQRQG
jgi:CheY-specific phosphatase CheX